MTELQPIAETGTQILKYANNRMSSMKEIYIVPEPKRLSFDDQWFTFTGFQNLPQFLAREFNVPKGEWKITKTERKGTGLKIKDKEVTIWGDEQIAYATILQLIKQRTRYLPEVEIEEKLKFGFRGYHLDIARGGVPTIKTFNKILRWLFLLKYNYFAIYYEDLYPWKKHPKLGAHRGRLTEEELKEVTEYGEKLGIEVFPSLELAGHTEHTLTLPEYRQFSEWHRPQEGCLDLSNEKAREFAYELLTETAENTRSRYIHIGGDETWALGRGESLSKTWKFEGPRLYELHHRKMIEIVKKAGKRPILWGDMISGMYLRGESEKWGEALESPIWKEVLVANWDYSPSPKRHFIDKIEIFRKGGIQQIACPGLSNWNRYYPNFQMALENIKNFLTAARETDLPGFLITAWGDDGEECLFSLLEPLLLASMEIAEGNGEWQQKWKTITGEDKSMLKARVLFGDPTISEGLKHVILRDFWFNRSTGDAREEMKDKWEKTLEQIEGTHLPGDLDLIRRMLEVGIEVLRNNAGVSDYIALSNSYSRLWLAERKPEGLERIVKRFWGVAGRTDLRLC